MYIYIYWTIISYTLKFVDLLTKKSWEMFTSYAIAESTIFHQRCPSKRFSCTQRCQQFTYWVPFMDVSSLCIINVNDTCGYNTNIASNYKHIEETWTYYIKHKPQESLIKNTSPNFANANLFHLLSKSNRRKSRKLWEFCNERNGCSDSRHREIGNFIHNKCSACVYM